MTIPPEDDEDPAATQAFDPIRDDNDWERTGPMVVMRREDEPAELWDTEVPFWPILPDGTAEPPPGGEP
jgi:hypothetical protein